jgi:hypothetical protein
MASTFTPLGVELQATGENAGTWGSKTNVNLQLIEQIAGGFTQQSIAGGAQTTALTISDSGTGDIAGHRMIEFTGTISGNQIVTIPNDVQNFYILRNSTSGSHTVQFKYASGSGSTFTFSATDKGDKIVFASASPDATDPNILTLAIGTGISEVSADTSPQLGGDLDTNSFNIAFDDAHGINDENGNEQIVFQTTSSAVNQFDVTNAATGNAPSISATGGDSNIDIALIPKGTGETKVGTGSADATITSSGAHNLILDTNSGTNSGTITITDGANGNIDLTPNGTGDVTLQADTVQIGDNNADATLTTQGTGDLILNTNNGTNAGNITLADGANGDINVSTNGTGAIKFNDIAYIPQQALTSSSNAVAWDAQAKPNAFHLTTENTTFSAPTNNIEGSFICLEINYNGSHTIAFNTVFEFAASTAPTFTSTDGKTDILVFRYNGTVWQEVGRTLNLSES